MNSSTPPMLIVTVDTEEEGLWSGTYRRTGNTVQNVVQGVPRFQALCDRFYIRPTYLVDAPVVQNDAAVQLLRKIQDGARAEIGAHLHPWCNPPLVEEVNGRNSYMCNLPEQLQHEKLEWLTDAIAERFGRRPTSFRAGRYGLDLVGARILADLGYRVDSSVIPFTDYSSQGGPNFQYAPYRPYFLDRGGMSTPHERGFLLEVPVSIGYSRPNFRRVDRLRRMALSPWLKRMRVPGMLDRLGLARRIKFSPEQAGARRLKQVVNAYIAERAPAIVLMLHSSSLVPGYSPYVRNEQDLAKLYSDLESTFAYCVTTHRMRAHTLTSLSYSYQTSGSSPYQPYNCHDSCSEIT